MSDEILQKLTESVTSLTVSVQKINEDNTEILRRLEVVEKTDHSSQKEQVSAAPTGFVGFDHTYTSAAGASGGFSRRAPSPHFQVDVDEYDYQAAGDIESQYLNVKDSVARIRLPNDHRLKDTRSGIKQKELFSYNIITKNARYVENALRVLSEMKDGYRPQQVQDLYIVLIAQLEYLKGSYANLVVKSNHSERTSKWFNQLQNNSSGLTESALKNLRASVDIANAEAAAAPPTRYGDQRNYRGGYNNYRGGFNNFSGRGNYNNRGNGFRNFRQPQRDTYQSLATSGVPTNRGTGQQDE